ncbi:CoA-binding protein [Thermobrachium celere]|uniref:CoA-binding domain protein n=1 Tax=Thermobrachium celere DSM 8682 TaxID=941824 RepID=R7RSW2_9CLOT|nr:CoA-binding protein [Thermobrachium celere]CDF58345.1 CoA-binding domain protein [Thermobrachium celere DSM 8682]
MIEVFKEKKTWAVIGSVSNKDKFANKIYNFMKNKGYKVYPVDPSGKELDGEKTFASLRDLPEKPDAIDMVINPVRGEKYIDEAAELGIKYVWFQPGAESFEVVEKAKNYGMEVMYGKCVMVEF